MKYQIWPHLVPVLILSSEGVSMMCRLLPANKKQDLTQSSLFAQLTQLGSPYLVTSFFGGWGVLGAKKSIPKKIFGLFGIFFSKKFLVKTILNPPPLTGYAGDRPQCCLKKEKRIKKKERRKLLIWVFFRVGNDLVGLLKLLLP